jgi:hypothetical protein
MVNRQKDPQTNCKTVRETDAKRDGIKARKKNRKKDRLYINKAGRQTD